MSFCYFFKKTDFLLHFQRFFIFLEKFEIENAKINKVFSDCIKQRVLFSLAYFKTENAINK